MLSPVFSAHAIEASSVVGVQAEPPETADFGIDAPLAAEE